MGLRERYRQDFYFFALLCELGRAAFKTAGDPCGHRNRWSVAGHGNFARRQKDYTQKSSNWHGGPGGLETQAQANRQRHGHRLLGAGKKVKNAEKMQSQKNELRAWP